MKSKRSCAQWGIVGRRAGAGHGISATGHVRDGARGRAGVLDMRRAGEWARTRARQRRRLSGGELHVRVLSIEFARTFRSAVYT